LKASVSPFWEDLQSLEIGHVSISYALTSQPDSLKVMEGEGVGRGEESRRRQSVLVGGLLEAFLWTCINFLLSFIF
jgi:hypothetical protein